jgi:hypothetical protein
VIVSESMRSRFASTQNSFCKCAPLLFGIKLADVIVCLQLLSREARLQRLEFRVTPFNHRVKSVSVDDIWASDSRVSCKSESIRWSLRRAPNCRSVSSS